MAMLLLVMVAGCKDIGDEFADINDARIHTTTPKVNEKDLAQIDLYLYFPEEQSHTRAEEPFVNGIALENEIKTLQIWVFDHTNHDQLLAYHEDANIVASGIQRIQFGIEGVSTNDEILAFAEAHTSADVFVVINGASMQENFFKKETSYNDLDGYKLSGNQFGVSSPISNPENGLPMSGVDYDAPITRQGKIFTIRQGTSINVVRAVSKVRFVFTRSKYMDNVGIKSVTLNGDLIATEESLFIPSSSFDANNHVIEANISGGYETASISYNNSDNSDVLTADDIKWHPDPLSLAWNPNNTEQTPQSWENAINNAIANEQATEFGRTYLRETDKRLSGTIVYKNTAGGYTTLPFEMAADDPYAPSYFFRNHTWTILGYFINGQLQLRVIVQRWTHYIENVDYKDEVSATQYIELTENTYANKEDVYDNSTTPATYQNSIVTMLPGVDVELTFQLETPVGGSWYATLETIEGPVDALVFANNGTTFMQGGIGPKVTMKIHATNPNPAQRNRARLHIVARDATEERTYEVTEAALRWNIIISQPIN